MDLQLYARVLWQHRVLLLAGVVVATFLAALSYWRFEAGILPSVKPRQAEVWQSTANVLLAPNNRVVPVPGYNGPDRLAFLAGLYARLATNDEVLARIQSGGGPVGSFIAASSVDPSRAALPVITLLGTGPTPESAQTTVSRGLEGFLAFVGERQAAAGVPMRDRVQLEVLNAPQPAALIQPRKRTLPVAVFLAVTMAAIGLAFVLENSRRRPTHVTEVALRPADEELDLEPAPPEVDEAETSVRRWA